MKRVPSLHDAATAQDVHARLARLGPRSQALWGRMDVAQMLAHCTLTLEMALGERTAPRSLLGRLLGPWAKRSLLVDGKPMRRHSPAPAMYVIADRRDFEVELQRLRERLDRFATGGHEACSPHPHSFFGPLTPEEWGMFMYVHLDHHLRQFGV